MKLFIKHQESYSRGELLLRFFLWRVLHCATSYVPAIFYEHLVRYPYIYFILGNTVYRQIPTKLF